ncbi:MAG: glycosidase [Clostridiales bacterium]|nr:glycosidase [Clostridiales bacterium]
MKQAYQKFRRSFALILALAIMLSTLSACRKEEKAEGWRAKEVAVIDDNYRTWYEIFVYSFCDSDGDGIGDLQGVISKLDYITDMGFNGIWLMPIMPSNSYHKYDVKDYLAIDPVYGTMDDFDELAAECNKRGIKLIIDLVLNHTSPEHPWFAAARDYLESLGPDEEPSAEECQYYGYYNFVKGNPSSNAWYQVGSSDYYYEGQFSPEMPDVNFASQELRKDFEAIMDFWLEKGVGGFRLDAVKEFYSGATDKNVEVLSWVNDYVKSAKPDAYIVGECWEGLLTYAQYYASGVDSFFDFEFAGPTGIITKTINYSGAENSAQAYAKALVRVQNSIREYREDAIDAPFFVNHDLARAAGYMSYDARKVKMAAALNILMSGSAFVYYGEEIGMTGSGRDENKRAPMFWSADADAAGITKGPQDMEPQENRFASAEEQMKAEDSIYSFYKDTILLRNQNPEIARGTVARLEEVEDQDIAAISKTYDGKTIYMLYNVSETDEKQVEMSQYGELEVAGYLSVDGGEVTIEDGTVTLPSYSVVVLAEKPQ